MKADPEKRRYYVIWKKIKTTGSCFTAVPVTLMPRVKKAVTKEKDMDVAFKKLNKHTNVQLVIEEDKRAGTMKFSLTTSKVAKSVGLGEIKYESALGTS
jgi:hypothetical protein